MSSKKTSPTQESTTSKKQVVASATAHTAPKNGAVMSRFFSSFKKRLTLILVLSLALAVLLSVAGIYIHSIVEKMEQNSAHEVELQRLKLEEARAKAAAIEAKQLNITPHNSDSSSSTGLVILPPDQSGNGDTSTHTPLPARDVQTIIDQEDMEGMLQKLAEEDAKRLAEEMSSHIEDSTEADAEAKKSASEANKLEQEFQKLSRDGINALIAGDMRRCILSLSQAATIRPHDPALLYYHGLAYDKLLNPSKAQEYYMALFSMRDAAGEYFKKASQRLTYGFANPAEMRGKLAFGPHLTRVDDQMEQGETVELVIPILLAEGEELQAEDVYIHIQFFDLTNGKDIQISHHEPNMVWESGTPTWETREERLLVQYVIPTSTQEQLDAFGEMKYYGFTAKLYYRGEPLDCISTPSSLILREYQLRGRDIDHSGYELLPTEEAFPAAQDIYPSNQEPVDYQEIIDNNDLILEGTASDGLLEE